MTKEEVLELITGEEYYKIRDLRYNQHVGKLMSNADLKEYLMIKDQLIDDGSDVFINLPLKSFNSKHCFFANGNYLDSIKKEYINILHEDYQTNKSWLSDRNATDMLISRLYSEVEGTLKIENVPTTRKRIREIHRGDNIVDQNDIIIKNMINALKYIINEKPEFNKNNLLILYHILSDNCLSEEDRLNEGMYYRHDDVFIDSFKGADASIVDDCMNSLFAFANDENNVKKYNFLLPYICHYYILYIHPYFDYNGRTARMVSFWICFINNITYAPYYMSEAINEYKQAYYNAIVETRTSNNDLTYFLGYILETAIKYSFVYKNLEIIKDILNKEGDFLTSSEYTYLKKIIAHNQSDFFNQKMFVNYIGVDMTKQGALKVLNQLTKYGVLEKGKNKKNETVFKLNQDMIFYRWK